MRTMIRPTSLLTTLILLSLAGCGGDAPATETTTAPPAAEPAGEPAATAPAPSTAAGDLPVVAEPDHPLGDPPPALLEAPEGTPTTYAELCAAQRQACLDGADAMDRLAADLADAEARADLLASLRRTAELEPLTLTLEPVDATALVTEQQAIVKAREVEAEARRKLEASPQGALLLQELVSAAREQE